MALFRTERSFPNVRAEHAGRIATETVLTVTVGVLLGRLAWVVLAPTDAAAYTTQLAATGATEPQPEIDGASEQLLTQMNPFAADSLVASRNNLVASETTLDIKLSGVRSVTGNATASSAIISFPDGGQKRFVPGDEVVPGVVLVNVTGDTVHLSRNGALETLSLYPNGKTLFAAAPEASASGALAAAETGPAISVTPAALANDTLLTPEYRSGEVSGYKLEPRGAGAFEAAGLQSGDLILRVNGQAVEGQRPDQIYQSVSTGTDLALDIVRQGAIVRLRVAPTASLSQ